MTNQVLQMEEYWRTRKPAATSQGSPTTSPSGVFLSEFDRLRQTLISQAEEGGWAAELRRYLKDMPADVTAEIDIVEWWQVCSRQFSLKRMLILIIRTMATYIRLSQELLLMSCLARHHQFPANAFSQQASKLQQINMRA